MAPTSLRHVFTAHPASVGESYVQHLAVAMKYSGWLFAAGFCALVHAVLPFLFETTASGMIRAMVADMDRRKAACGSGRAAVQPAE
jgi:hypothetical protein